MSQDMTKNEAMNDLYNSTLATLGAVGVGMLTRKVIIWIINSIFFNVYFEINSCCWIIYIGCEICSR